MTRTFDYFRSGSTGSGRRWDTTPTVAWVYGCHTCGWTVGFDDERPTDPDCAQCRTPTALVAWPGM
jgi:hypothetical protein